MPIYEYQCRDCGKRFSFLIFSIKEEFEPRCSFCGSINTRRLISRVRVLKSEEARLENLADPSKFADLDEKDPASVARWMKKFGKEMGEDLGPEFEEELDKAVQEEYTRKEKEESSSENFESEE